MSSRYMSALHSKTFDSAVRKFREKENEKTETLAQKTTPRAPRTHSDSSLPTAAEAVSEVAQRELERLPQEIIKQVQSFYDHMQFFVNNAGVAGEEAVNGELQGSTTIPRQLRKLLNEIAQFEDIGGRAKREILEDDESRNVSVTRPSHVHTLIKVVVQTLLLLSIESACLHACQP